MTGQAISGKRCPGWKKSTQCLSSASQRVIKMLEVCGRVLSPVGKPLAFVWGHWSQKLVPAPLTGSLLLCRGKGAAWDGFVMGLGLTLLLDSFQVDFSGLSYPSMVSSAWLGPFFLLAVLLPWQPECCPLWQALWASILQHCILLCLTAALHHHLTQFLGKPVQPAPQKGCMGHPAMSRPWTGGRDVLCLSPPRCTHTFLPILSVNNCILSATQ